MTDLPAKPPEPGPKPPEPAAQAPQAPPTEIAQILEKIPQEQRKVVEQSISMMMQVPMIHPIFGKIDGTHIHKMLDAAENDSKRDWEDQSERRTHLKWIAVIGLAGFLAISGLFLWFKAGDLLKGILIGFALFAGGLGAGARFLKEESDD